MPSRRLLLTATALAMPAMLASRRAAAQEVTLRLHHFLPAVSNVHRHFLVPWANKLREESGGRLRVQIFPSMQLGGAPPQLYDQAKDGVADIVWTLPGNTPGRFPRIEVIELPFLAHKRASVNARVTWELFDRHMRAEFGETHMITAWAHDHGLIHARREVRTMEDLRGLKLRFPTRQAGEALRALGATAIGLPIPQVPEALSQGVIDGAVVPWEVVPAIRLHEMVRNHVGIPGSPTFYVASFVLAMNKARYEGLPAELRRVLDANSGAVAAEMAAKVWDEEGPKVEEIVRRRGNAITEITAEEKARWQAACAPVVQAWIAQLRERGVDGGALVEEARALIARYGQGVA
ncbi:TRAP transporter substrate-binding protein [Roseomonas alkaliterrae]|jgi:TRAP-type C4-dicarboxylate transport system substrate-binding protein|uniref:TRAP-type C4-dicarboxylate transport system substrate-binding protein n=1 Tax=Neoroseomonas alkaliterrae TaxID=1452450 RepID=A0A840Y928_9PROT|nr:TRAP transporter substrate-binding protein [Neoroseomonas alkaliterrae]MBB5690364.1 TRAP-type C4-dicarboxylate transport system substrate-binding protein [Neoroseomonas alkaliterrae]MBR0675178.1 TRAP transporter substrate-binding protein [Neoroseomonas alkaliterrae]